VPTSILWGVHDPWEKVEWGRALAAYPCVEEFVEVEAGHCPMDEAPGMVNPLIAAWMSRYEEL
jgi:pimeloyl-ACP methyl ester carboxylesterase